MRSGTLLLAVGLLLAPFTGCVSPAEGGPSGVLAFETIDHGSNSEIEDREETVVRSDEAWRQLWDRHAPDDERPEVDFEETMVLAVFKGESPDGCHGAEIENVTGEGGSIEVEGAYYEVTDAYCTQQITYPFHVVALDHHEEPVTFTMRDEERQRGNGSDPGGGDGSTGRYTCQGSGAGQTIAATGEEAGFSTLDRGDQSRIRERCLTVAENETAWRNLWRAHHGGSTADDERPEVDFEENVVAAIFKGHSPDACHGAEIENVTRDGLDLVVEGVFYEVTGSACAEVVTYPFHIVETERPEGEVRFDVRNETRERNGTDDGSSDEPAYRCRSPSSGEELPTAQQASLSTLDEGSASRIHEPCATVVDSEKAWRSLWHDHAGSEASRPSVDFQQNVVAALFKGESPDTCSDAEIQNVSREGIDRVVHGVFVEDPEGPCGDQITYPFHIVETERPEGEVRFDVRNETR